MSAINTPTPIPLIPSPLPPKTSFEDSPTGSKIAHDLAHMQNLFLRGFNSIILQAPHITSGTPEAADCLLFTKILCDVFYRHLQIEEEYTFPKVEEALDQKGFMDVHVEQHKSFADALATIHKYSESTSSQDFSSSKLTSLINDLTPKLCKNMNDEIDTFVSLTGKAKDADLWQIWLGMKQYAESQSIELSAFLPVYTGCHDVTFGGGWQQGTFSFPTWAVYLNDWVLYRRYNGAWRFLWSDSWGRPKKLTFLPESEGGLGIKA
jgi:Hemerythrin HHE cation binding domain